MKDPSLIKKGTTLDQFKSSQEWMHAAKVINLFDGRKKIKLIAHQEVKKVING